METALRVSRMRTLDIPVAGETWAPAVLLHRILADPAGCGRSSRARQDRHTCIPSHLPFVAGCSGNSAHRAAEADAAQRYSNDAQHLWRRSDDRNERSNAKSGESSTYELNG